MIRHIRVLFEFLALLVCLSCLAVAKDVLELWLLLLKLLQVLMHLLLILKSLEGGHLARIGELALHLAAVGHSLRHHLLWHLLHVVHGHLLLANHDAFIVADSRHVDHLGLELVWSVAVLPLLLA